MSPPGRNKPVTFLDIFNREGRYPIFNQLCSILSIAEIISLTRVCKKLSNLYQYLVPIQWQVNQRLRRFVRDPLKLRLRMCEYDALISGSFVLQYFERVLWEESDLDIFIKQGDGADAFGRYLVKEEGYVLVKTQGTEAGYVDNDLEVVWSFTRPETRLFKSSTVQVIVTRDIPIQAILRGFYMTSIVNILTWSKAYAIFPLPTFIHHRGYLLSPDDDDHKPLLAKYEKRGWEWQYVLKDNEAKFNHPIRFARRIGDRYTWTIPLDTRGVEWPKTSDSVIEYSSFGMTLAISSIKNYWVDAELSVSPALRYQFTCGNDNWMKYLYKRVDQLTIAGVMDMEPTARPPNFEENFTRVFHSFMHDQIRVLLRNFQKPEGWKHYDKEVPRWFEAWKESLGETMNGIKGVPTKGNTSMLHR